MTNADNTIRTHIDKISYQFALDGDISVYGHITPPLQTDNGMELDKIILTGLMTAENSGVCPSPGDAIDFVADRSDGIEKYIPQFCINDEVKKDQRLNIERGKCPICGSVLLPSETGFGRCINRACRGQISQTMILFCSGLGLSFTFAFKKIFEMLLVRGAFCTPVDIFRITEDDLSFPGVSHLDAQSFLQYVHSVRGTTSVSQLLRALRIPSMSNCDIELIQAFFHVNNISIDGLIGLLNEEHVTELNGERLPLDGLRSFVAIPENLQLFKELCIVLK